MRLAGAAARVVFTVGAVSVLCAVVGRPPPVMRPYRDVATLQGAVRGYFAPNPPHFQYFGVPYARPPTRRDRFKAPKPPPEWDGIFEATHKIKCPQLNADGEENCLVVNVFVPEQATRLPVIVFVHDGDFQNGWGAYQPSVRFLREAFILVTFNYRLGALGFLSLGTPNAPGNAGLKDQIAALYWVHRNIASFGGNPREVTAYGIGSGAASVQLVLLSGLVNDFLHKVILESGSVLSPSTLTYDPLSIAYDGAKSLGYEGTDDPDILYNFYKETPSKDLITIPQMFLPNVRNESEYLHSLIDMDPLEKLENGNFHKVPMLITLTHKNILSIIEKDSRRFDKPPETFEYLLPNNIEFNNHRVRHRVGEIVKEFYFHEDLPKDNVAQSYADYMNDIFTEYPIVKIAILFAAKNTYYVYVMKFTLSRESGTWGEAYSFNTVLDYLYQDNEQADSLVIQKLMTLWRNFIQLGDPTPLTTTLIPLIWQPVTCDRQEKIYISDVPMLLFDTTLKMSTQSSNQRLTFWDNIYRRFYKPHVVQSEQSEEVEDDSYIFDINTS